MPYKAQLPPSKISGMFVVFRRSKADLFDKNKYGGQRNQVCRKHVLLVC